MVATAAELVPEVREWLSELYEAAGEAPPVLSDVEIERALSESAKLDRCVKQVAAKGDADEPYAVCRASLGEECQCEKCKAKPVVESNPVILDVPDERQSTNYSCGAAATVSVAKFFGIEPDTEAEAIVALKTSPLAGTPPEEIVRVLTDHGLAVEHHDWFDLDGLKKHLDQGHPSICPVQMYGSPNDYNADASGHWVVLIGCDTGKVILQDPVSGQVQMEDAEFKSRWHDRDQGGTPYERYAIVVKGPGQSPDKEEPSKPEVN